MSDQDVVVKDSDYFMANPEAYDALTDAQRLELLNNGLITVGDTDSSASPDTTAKVDADNTDGSKDSVADSDGKADQPEKVETAAAEAEGILSKDGKHVIPFSRLTEAQDEAAKFRTLAEQQQALIEKLTTAQDADKGTGDTKAQEDVLEELRAEFPELAEKLAPAISKLVEQGVSATVAKLTSLIEPLQANANESAADKHFNAIRAAHSDFDTLMAGDAVDKWIEKQPAFVRGRYQEVLEKGTASEVNELLSSYKEANKQPAPGTENNLSAEDVAKAAKQVVDKAKNSTKVPVSLSDVPAGSIVNTDELTAMADLSPVALMAKFEGKTPEQIDAIISKVV